MKATSETNRGKERRIIRSETGSRKDFRDKIARNAAFPLTKARTKGNFTRKRVCQVDRVSTWKWIPAGRIAPSRCAWAGLSLCNSRLLNSKGWWWTKRGGECGSSRATSSWEGRRAYRKHNHRFLHWTGGGTRGGQATLSRAAALKTQRGIRDLSSTHTLSSTPSPPFL